MVGDVQELQKKGMGGLWHVGKGAEFPPLLAVLEYTPAKTSKKDFKLALCTNFSPFFFII